MSLFEFMKSLTNNGCSVDGTLLSNNPLTTLINQAIGNGRISRQDGDIFSRRVSEAACA